MADADDMRLAALPARDEAAHLAGADIDDSDGSPRAYGQFLHVVFPGWRLFLAAGFCISAPVRTTRRSGRRRSTSSMSLLRCRVQRRPPTRTAAVTWLAIAGSVASMSRRAAPFAGASSPTRMTR